MGSRTECLFLVPSDTAVEILRRYAREDVSTCPRPFGGGYPFHDAEVQIGMVPYTPDRPVVDLSQVVDDAALRADSRWPAICRACGYRLSRAITGNSGASANT
jgi:hypothetical protein